MNDINGGNAKGASKDALFRVLGGLTGKALVAFMLASVCLFSVWPLICNLWRGFTGPDGTVTLKVFADVWQRYRHSLLNSVLVGAAASVLCTAVSVCAALFLSSRRSAARIILTGIILVAMVAPPFVSSLAYIQLYGRRGWITYRLLGLRLNPYNCIGVILMQSLSFAPLNALFLGGLLGKIDAGSLASAADLGAGEPNVLSDVVLMQLRPGIIVTLLLTFIRSLADFGTPVIIGGRFSTLAADIYLQIVGFSNLERASAMSALLLIPAILAFFAYRAMMSRSRLLSEAGRAGQSAPEINLRKCGAMGVTAIVLSVVFFAATAIQYGCVFVSGFLKSSRGAYTFTSDNLAKLFSLDGETLLRSVVYALFVAVVGTLFAVVFSYLMDRRRIPGRAFFDCAATFPYMIPGICFGISYILAFNKAPMKLTGTAAIVLINMLFKQLPTTTKICSAALAGIPKELERSVADLGGGGWATLRDAVWPCIKPAVVECFSYNFSSSMTTAGAILFLINPGSKLAVFKLFDAVYTGDYAMASMIASFIIAAVLIAEGIAYAAIRKETHRATGVKAVKIGVS